MELIKMHKSLSVEYFGIQLADLERNGYVVDKKSDEVVVVTRQEGQYLLDFRVQGDQFDLEPPLIEFADPNTGERLADHLWPQGQPIINGGNSIFPGKMLCRTGNRAYHTHQSHLIDPFSKHRNGFTLRRFLDVLVERITSGQINMMPTGGIYNATR